MSWILTCGICLEFAEAIGNGMWRCLNGHEFRGGPCPDCNAPAWQYPPPLDGVWHCSQYSCVSYEPLEVL